MLLVQVHEYMCICLCLEHNIGKDISIQELMDYGYQELRYIIEWAKKVPGTLYSLYLYLSIEHMTCNERFLSNKCDPCFHKMSHKYLLYYRS